MPYGAFRLGSWIGFRCLCVLLHAAAISSSLCPFLSFFLSFSHYLSLGVRASCTQGRGCLLKASFHTHQGGSLLFHTQTMTCTFLSCLTWWPCACECVTRWNGIFSKKVFYWMKSAGKYLFHLWLAFLALCVSRYWFISGREWYITSPAGWCELVVSFMISIDESSLGESISRGCSLVAHPPLPAVPD